MKYNYYLTRGYSEIMVPVSQAGLFWNYTKKITWRQLIDEWVLKYMSLEIINMTGCSTLLLLLLYYMFVCV